VTLVVPGYTTAFEHSLRRHADAVAPGRVRFTGWLDEPTLEGLYAAATVFVFPSLAEGFGLPVLDALARGVPVACSDATSLPEVAGTAARYFDPTDTDAIAQAIEELLGDPSRRDRLRRAGLEQARRFSWNATAEATLASYARATSVTASAETPGVRAQG
jgi:glycosyltransferase involved in cell wall biosynthesis